MINVACQCGIFNYMIGSVRDATTTDKWTLLWYKPQNEIACRNDFNAVCGDKPWTPQKQTKLRAIDVSERENALQREHRVSFGRVSGVNKMSPEKGSSEARLGT